MWASKLDRIWDGADVSETDELGEVGELLVGARVNNSGSTKDHFWSTPGML